MVVVTTIGQPSSLHGFKNTCDLKMGTVTYQWNVAFQRWPWTFRQLKVAIFPHIGKELSNTTYNGKLRGSLVLLHIYIYMYLNLLKWCFREHVYQHLGSNCPKHFGIEKLSQNFVSKSVSGNRGLTYSTWWWKWNSTPKARKLILEGPLFHFHDYGRKGSLWTSLEFQIRGVVF